MVLAHFKACIRHKRSLEAKLSRPLRWKVSQVIMSGVPARFRGRRRCCAANPALRNSSECSSSMLSCAPLMAAAC